MENLIDKIIELLKLRGFTQSGLERAAGLSENRISKWKSGVGEPSIYEAARIARLLDVSLDELVDAQKPALPVNDLTEDERLIVTVVRKARLSSEDVIQRLMPKEKKKAVVRPHRSKPKLAKEA